MKMFKYILMFFGGIVAVYWLWFLCSLTMFLATGSNINWWILLTAVIFSCVEGGALAIYQSSANDFNVRDLNNH